MASNASTPPSVSSPTVVLIEDETVFRQLLKRALLKKKGWEDVSDFSDGQQGLDYCLKSPPELLLVDLNLPGRHGLDIIREVRRCSDQWNPLKIAFDRPHEADFPEALMKLSWRERGLVLRDMWNFIVLFKEFKWGRQIAAAALQRPLFGGYPIQRWL